MSPRGAGSMLSARATARSRRPWRRSRRSAWRWRKFPRSACWSASCEQRRRRCRHVGQRVELAHEAPVDPVLPAPHPCAFDDQAIAGTDRLALAGRDEIKRLALRAKRAQGLATQGAADVFGKHRAGANGVNARLRQVARREGDGVSSRENVVMPGNAQVSSTWRKPWSRAEGGLRQPARRCGLRGPEDLVDLDRG